ncbi:hypothetical protein E8E14_000411 [Neopestalotiopsis sp. 37M]|nr:hypothetical protein E8E14_000411 [Neopestalotiopsis sp. 37M]
MPTPEESGARAHRKMMRTKHHTGCSDQDRNKAVNHAIYGNGKIHQWQLERTALPEKSILRAQAPSAPRTVSVGYSSSASTSAKKRPRSDTTASSTVISNTGSTSSTPGPRSDTPGTSQDDVTERSSSMPPVKKAKTKKSTANEQPENAATIAPRPRRGRPPKAPGAPEAPYKKKKTADPSLAKISSNVQQPSPPSITVDEQEAGMTLDDQDDFVKEIEAELEKDSDADQEAEEKQRLEAERKEQEKKALERRAKAEQEALEAEADEAFEADFEEAFEEFAKAASAEQEGSSANHEDSCEITDPNKMQVLEAEYEAQSEAKPEDHDSLFGDDVDWDDMELKREESGAESEAEHEAQPKASPDDHDGLFGYDEDEDDLEFEETVSVISCCTSDKSEEE